MAKEKSSSDSSVFRSILYFLIQVLIVLAVLTFLPGLPPDNEFKSYKINLQPFSLNGKLNNAEILFLNEIEGPEDFAVYKNELYTSTHGGYVQKIFNGKLHPVVRFGKNCKGLFEEHICGRPLSLRFNSKGELYVCDAYYGIFKVNVSTGAYSNIVSINEPIDGVLPKIPNGIALSEKTGDFYWTDSSTSHYLYDGAYTLLANGNGRLIKYNKAKGKNEVLLKNLYFPNGVAMSKDESFLVVAETYKSRLLKFHLKGPKSGQTEVFAELPGFPDNMDYSEGKFNVAIIHIPDGLSKILPELPLLRKLISRIVTLIELVINEVEALCPSEILKQLTYQIGHLHSFKSIFAKASPVIIQSFNENGKLLESLSATDGKVNDICSFIKFQGYYYLGSPFNNYIARVKYS